MKLGTEMQRGNRVPLLRFLAFDLPQSAQCALALRSMETCHIPSALLDDHDITPMATHIPNRMTGTSITVQGLMAACLSSTRPRGRTAYRMSSTSSLASSLDGDYALPPP